MTQISLDRLATTRTIERSAGHQYTLVDQDGPHGPYPGCTPICQIHDSLGGTGGLVTWAANQTLEAIELLGIWSGDLARAAAFTAVNGPRDVGNAVHSAVDRFNRNQPLELTDTTAPYVAQYAAALRKEGIEILGSERYVVNTTVGFGGTYDSLVEVWDHNGGADRGILDVKTGKEKASQRLQLTGLSMGEYHGEAGLEAEPMPPLDSVGWILLLRPDGYQLIRHDITDEDRDHFIRLVATYHQIREWSAR